MKKKLIAILLLTTLGLSGCGNKQIIDTNYIFNKAIIKLGDECITVDVEKWNDYQDSDSIQIISKDGNAYYTHISNVVLMKK
jgi:uncharacterized lipoprotein NlpE involved in copper resistance